MSDQNNPRQIPALEKDPALSVLDDFGQRLRKYKNQEFYYADAIKAEPALKPPDNLPPEIAQKLNAYTPITTVSQIAIRVDEIIGERALALLLDQNQTKR